MREAKPKLVNSPLEFVIEAPETVELVKEPPSVSREIAEDRLSESASD